MNILHDYRICRAELKECVELKEEYVLNIFLCSELTTQATIQTLAKC
jgi:hypothetical protein